MGDPSPSVPHGEVATFRGLARRYRAIWAGSCALCVGLATVSFSNYLLFHALSELFAIIVGALLVVSGWFAYRYTRDGFLVFLASGYFWVGLIDLVHLLAYQGMGVFPVSGATADTATQLWVAARYAEAVMLVAAPSFLDRPVVPSLIFFGWGGIAALLVGAVFTGGFPHAFIEGQGLTPFKVGSEYVIIAILAAALWRLIAERGRLDRALICIIGASIVLTMASELLFTFYVSVYGLSNLFGHLFKFLAFTLILVAVIESLIVGPLDTLARLRDVLEALVRERTSSLEHEVAERRRIEADLRAAKTAAETANRAKSMFLASMSHELRTPLNAICGFSEMMANEILGPIPKPYSDYPRMVLQSGRFLLRLINDVLDMAKLEAGTMEVNREPVDIARIIGEVLEVVAQEAEKAKVRLLWSGDDAAGMEICVDPLRIKQALANVVVNAIRHSRGGSVSVAIGCAGGRCHIVVSDTGIGMTSEQIAVALQPFGQLEGDSYIRTHAGAGLGLPLTRRLVEIQGGRLQIASEPGRGTTVSIDLPA